MAAILPGTGLPAAPGDGGGRRAVIPSGTVPAQGGPLSARGPVGALTRWLLPGCLVAGHLLAAGLNATALGGGEAPSAVGVAASVGYLVAWLGYAFRAGRCAECVPVRRLAGFWAAAVAAAAIGGSLLRQAPSAVPEGASGFAVVLVVTVALPLYGIAGLFAVDPVAGLVPTALASAIVVTAVVAATRRPGRAAAGVSRRGSAAGQLAVRGAVRAGEVDPEP